MEETAISPVFVNASPRRRVSLATAAGGLFLFGLWFVLCRHLSGEWSVNEQYSYGWFVPFFALFLFWLRWEGRPKAEVGGRRSEVSQRAVAALIAIIALLMLLPIRLFEVGNPDWRPLGWLHTAAVVGLTFVIISSAGGGSWVRHFAFPIAFFFVAVPWPATFEQTIVQGLMRVVAAVATEALNLCGIPAQLEGSLIRVNTGLVGVNEACSGVRSLQTSLMIGLLFGELKRLSTARRVVLVATALGIALLANFGRAFFLVWIAATQEPAAVERWHDFAGYSIVALVFIGSMAVAAGLGRKAKAETRKRENAETLQTESETGQRFEVRDQRPGRFSAFQLFSFSAFSSSFFLFSFLWLFAVEVAVEVWYRSHESDAVRRVQWTVRWPESAPEFREMPIDEGVKSILRFDAGRQGSWALAGPGERPEPPLVPAATNSPRARAFLFFFRWNPGSSSILRARAHRPDICLPNVGWRQITDGGVRLYPIASNLALPFRRFSFVRDLPGQRPLFAQAFFCIYEDATREVESNAVRFDPGSAAPRASLSERWKVVQEGLRNPGQQVMELVLLTENAIEEQQAEERFAVLVREMVVAEESRK